MQKSPEVVAFDAIGTLFSLEALRPKLKSIGVAGNLLEAWLAMTLRDAFALDTTGIYRNFRDVATSALATLSAEPAEEVDHQRLEDVVGGFAELDAHADAAPAMQALRDADVRIVVLTNGSAKVTGGLLDRAGLSGLVERVVSIDEVERWKPAREVYSYCATTMGVHEQRLALVAAHGWDIQGGRRAGLITGFVSRDGWPFPRAMDPPDVVGSTLIEVVAGLRGGG